MSPLLNRRQLGRLGLLAGAAALPALAQKNPAAIPIEHFFQHANFSHAQLNASGSHVAMLVGGDGGLRRLVVLELATMKPTPVAALQEIDVVNFQWISDRRLLFITHDEKEGGDSRGLMAVDLDGERFKRLRRWGRPIPIPGDYRGDEVLLGHYEDQSDGGGFLKLQRLDTVSGKLSELELPAWSQGFLPDEKGEPQYALSARGAKAVLHARGPAGAWRQLREFDRFFNDAFELHARGADGQLYVLARRGRDTNALYVYEPKTDSLADKPVLAVAGFDIAPELIEREGRLLGLHLTADATTTVWFDEAHKKLQQQIDAKLPSTSNLLQLPRQGDSPWVLIWAFSDRQPGLALAYHRETGKLTLLGRHRTPIDPAQMSAMDYVSYKARDGRSVPAYLSLPRSAGERRPLPLVVLVHGGPWARGGAWGWNAEVQFLTSRGYAVLQPEFRGSTGFGQAHFEAGWKQWGLAMQDDLADGARWAVAQGIADPKRIAIMGASYGGYAAMMGLARQDDVFACAVNWVGVTDLELLYSAHWSDISASQKSYGLPRMLGDRKADAELLRANSPIQLAERIKKPVLMAYGADDLRVPREHGERMRSALRHNSQLEWAMYEREGHGWFRLETQKDFWGRVERFLARHLGG